MNSTKTQIGGNHYANLAIQPVEYAHKNDLGFIEGCVVKYVTRWRQKNGIEDLQKAKHFIDLLIEYEAPEQVLPEFDEKRMDVVGQNGNDGQCYDDDEVIYTTERK